MMLWDIIRDFFVQYVFGGIASDGYSYSPFIGTIMVSIDGEIDDSFGAAAGDLFVKTPFGTGANYSDNVEIYLNFGDYLSTTATIIVMVLLCVLLVKLAIWIFKLGANLIRLR